MKTVFFVLIVGLALVPVTAQASLITARPAGTTTVLATVTGTSASAPTVTAGGFFVFAPSGGNVWYGDSYFPLIDNGSWGPGFAWVGGSCASGPCIATIDLGGSYSAVGGFMNYAFPVLDPLIEALAADGTTVLESYDLATLAPISTPGGVNAGAFRGIQRTTADIAYFRISGDYLIMHDLTLPVPEPTSLLLLGTGLVGLRAWRKRRG